MGSEESPVRVTAQEAQAWMNPSGAQRGAAAEVAVAFAGFSAVAERLGSWRQRPAPCWRVAWPPWRQPPHAWRRDRS